MNKNTRAARWRSTRLAHAKIEAGAEAVVEAAVDVAAAGAVTEVAAEAVMAAEAVAADAIKPAIKVRQLARRKHSQEGRTIRAAFFCAPIVQGRQSL
jgi:hypothetical protein